MFTGIVAATGTVRAVEPLEDGRLVTIEAPPEITEDLAVGDSVAVDGACLTAVRVDPGAFRVQAIGTTLSRTVVSRYRAGTRVNLERALRVGDRLDGHMVQGHVDGLGELVRTEERGEYVSMDFRVPPEVHRLTVVHGSITLNGVSLTVNDLPEPGVCQVAIIPHTRRATNLGGLRPGDAVNVEGDLIGKYVGRILAPRPDSPESTP